MVSAKLAEANQTKQKKKLESTNDWAKQKSLSIRYASYSRWMTMKMQWKSIENAVISSRTIFAAAWSTCQTRKEQYEYCTSKQLRICKKHWKGNIHTSGGSQTHSPVVRLAYMCSLVRGSIISTHSILQIKRGDKSGPFNIQITFNSDDFAFELFAHVRTQTTRRIVSRTIEWKREYKQTNKQNNNKKSSGSGWVHVKM